MTITTLIIWVVCIVINIIVFVMLEKYTPGSFYDEEQPTTPEATSAAILFILFCCVAPFITLSIVFLYFILSVGWLYDKIYSAIKKKG